MKYLLLIYENESAWTTAPKAEQEKVFADYMEFTRQIRHSGHLVSGEALQPTATARTVRRRDDKVHATDGPFAETREQLGGFYLVEAKDLDEAAALAARVPSARWGSIEVRPIMPTPMPE